MLEEKTNILLVEDNPDDVVLTLRAFKKNNIDVQVDVASDGEEALNYLDTREGNENELPRLVLLDLQLPKVGGLDVLKHIREHKGLRNLTVVVLTTSNLERDMDTAYSLGANDYIRKPLDLAEFNSIVKDLAGTYLGL
ncbi:MAG: response regulator [Chitinispirillaceae bacterium]